MAPTVATPAAAVALRPKLVWRLVNPVLALTMSWSAATDLDWRSGLGVLFFAVMTAAAFGNYARLSDGVLYRRGLARWHEPLRLSEITHVSLCRVLGNERVYMPLKLSITDAAGRVEEFTLRWWTNTDDLLAAVAEAVSDESPDVATMRTWRIELGRGTERRLRHYVYRHARP